MPDPRQEEDIDNPTYGLRNPKWDHKSQPWSMGPLCPRCQVRPHGQQKVTSDSNHSEPGGSRLHEVNFANLRKPPDLSGPVFSPVYWGTLSHPPNLTVSGRSYLTSLSSTPNQHRPAPAFPHEREMLLHLQALVTTRNVPLPRVPGT